MSQPNAIKLSAQLSQALNDPSQATAEITLLKQALNDLEQHQDDTHVAALLKNRLSLLAVQQHLSPSGIALLAWLQKNYVGAGAQRGFGLTRL